MTEVATLALITAVPPTLVALGGLIVSLRNSAKADVIVGHVNSAASASAAKIDALEKEIISMRAVMADNKAIAALLAQSLASAAPAHPATSPPLAGEPVAAIEKNTAAIEKNTR